MESALGSELRSIRKLKGNSLKSVAEPAGISTAYLQKLETGDVKNPSPNVLHGIAQVLDISYSKLMELAGYVVPGSEGNESASIFDHALASADLTEADRRAIAAFIAHLRDARSS